MNHLEKLYAARIEQIDIGVLMAEFEEAKKINDPSARAAANLIEAELKRRYKHEIYP